MARERTFVSEKLLKDVVKFYKKHPLKDIPKAFNISINTARYIIFELAPQKCMKKNQPCGISKQQFEKFLTRYTKWGDIEEHFGIGKWRIIEFLKENYNTPYLGRVKYELGLENVILGVPFSQDEDSFILENYETLGASQIGRVLNRSKESIYGRYLRLNNISKICELDNICNIDSSDNSDDVIASKGSYSGEIMCASPIK